MPESRSSWSRSRVGCRSMRVRTPFRCGGWCSTRARGCGRAGRAGRAWVGRPRRPGRGRLQRLVAQRRHDPAFDVLDGGLRLRLVPRRPGPRRQHGGSVVGGQFLVRRVQVRLVAAGLADRGLLVVRDHELGHPAPELEHPDMRHRPVRQRTAPGHVHEGVVRGAEDADEDHGVSFLPGAPVHHRELRARVVDERLLARPVDLPHDHVELSPPGLVALAEPAVLVAVRMNRPILQPQQPQGHALVALKLPVDVPPVRLRPGNPRRRGSREQRRLQRGVVQLLRQRPREARRPCPPHVVAHRAVGDAERRGDLAVAAPELVLQAQQFSNLPHGQPLLRHPLPPRLRGPRRGWKKASLQQVLQRSYSLTPG